MGGREKRAPRTPAEEREQLRQLTRELHEQAQAARDALRELRAADITRAAEKRATLLIEQQERKLEVYFDEQLAQLNKLIEAYNDQVHEHFTGILRLGGRDLILQTCAMVMHLSNPNITVKGWVESFIADAGRHRVHGCPCPGCNLILAPEVMISTKEQLDAFIAGGGDPGLVLDLRKRRR